MSPPEYHPRIHADLMFIDDGEGFLVDDLDLIRLRELGLINLDPNGDGTTYILTDIGRSTLTQWSKLA